MITEKLHWPADIESANTSSLKSQILQSLKTSDEYRYAFVEEKIQSGLAAQINTIREQRELDPKKFAEALGKKISWVYRLEDPNQPPPTIPSLLEVAKALDVDLEVRFRAFSELLDDLDKLNPESLKVPSFKEELPKLENSISQDNYRASWVNASDYAAVRLYADGTKRMLEAAGIDPETVIPISLQDVNAFLWGQPVVSAGPSVNTSRWISSTTKKPIGREMLSGTHETVSATSLKTVTSAGPRGFTVIEGGKKKQDGKPGRRRDSMRTA